jgi:hypothetical protein
MLEEIAAGVVLVLSIFFIYVSMISWKRMREKKYIFLTFVFLVFFMKGISYILLLPFYIYPSLDAFVLIFLYLVIVLR